MSTSCSMNCSCWIEHMFCRHVICLVAKIYIVIESTEESETLKYIKFVISTTIIIPIYNDVLISFCVNVLFSRFVAIPMEFWNPVGPSAPISVQLNVKLSDEKIQNTDIEDTTHVFSNISVPSQNGMKTKRTKKLWCQIFCYFNWKFFTWKPLTDISFRLIISDWIRYQIYRIKIMEFRETNKYSFHIWIEEKQFKKRKLSIRYVNSNT